MAEIPPNRTSCCFIDDNDEDDGAYVSYVSKLSRSSIISLRRSVSGYASSPTRHYAFRFDHFQNRQPHFLESCFLCRKPLASDSDVFMYRGDTPFCSEECRSEQIEIDEVKERRSMKSGRQIDPNSNESERLSCRDTGTIVTA